MPASLRSGSSGTSSRLLLRAACVLPMVGAPISDGAVLIERDRVAAVGKWSSLRHESPAQMADLGEVILFPGLINAHCHLDYTGMAGQIPPPKSFPDWIKAILPLKAHQGYSDYALAWLHGAKMLLAHGTTTVIDIEAVPELLPEVWQSTPLRIGSLLELTGVRSRRRPAEILQGAVDLIHSLPSGRCWAGLSPHAPYSTPPELLALAATEARRHQWLVAVHVGESAEEFEMYAQARGSMFEWLQNQREMSDCGRGSPVECLRRQGLLDSNLLAIHANYLAPGDAELLGRAGASVVHCPRSHEYFGHAPFPRGQLEAAGVNICLGTDSLASVRRFGRAKLQLDLFAELRTFLNRDRNLSAEAALRAVTLNAAKAIGRAGRLGELSPGACADLVCIPREGRSTKPYDLVLAHTGPVRGVMIGGRWALAPSPL